MPYLCSVKHSPPNKASLNTRVDQPGPCGDGNCIPYVGGHKMDFVDLPCL